MGKKDFGRVHNVGYSRNHQTIPTEQLAMKAPSITYRQIVARYSAIVRAVSPTQWVQATEWYTNASTVAQEIAGHIAGPGAFEKACGIIAAFSPRSYWSTNIRRAFAYVRGQVVPTMRSHIEAADRVMTSGLSGLRGPKVSAFARAIAGDASAVVIDTWMIQAAGLPSTTTLSPKQYDLFARAITTIANRNGVEPRILQAAIWVHVRGRHE